MLSHRIGCSKVKSRYQALNHWLVGIDPVRVATLAKNPTFYILNRIKADLYGMCEIAHIQLPFSLDQIPLFISQLNKAIKVISCFQNVVSGNKHNYARNPKTPTENTIHQIIDTKVLKKRKTIFSHYSY
ncbi:hypothetical protein CLU79DRAFT_1063 [Phycomyces nitens]|nr:hypothetical protein CLU79DRAFT_1063 [Phycomyces nitens]